MGILGALVGVALILTVLIDAFETTILPRRVTHRFRFARFFLHNTWVAWRAVALRLPAGKWRESFLSVFGPLALLGLLAAWVLVQISGFAILYAALGMALHTHDGDVTFWTYFYMSGITFFTLGYGDVTPAAPLGQALATVEAGLGFGFLAIIISYLPVIYSVYSRREALIGLLDARAGSPPSAAEFLTRIARAGGLASLDTILAEWEQWSAELLESHLSFPMVGLYRSQHDNQSWLAALTMILDTCALLLVAVKGPHRYRAQLTFAVARHAAVDLALVVQCPPVAPDPDRLPAQQCQQLRDALRAAGLDLNAGPTVTSRLGELRGMYEGFVNGLAQRFLFRLPPFVLETPSADNWQRSAWMKRTPAIGALPLVSDGNEHFA